MKYYYDKSPGLILCCTICSENRKKTIRMMETILALIVTTHRKIESKITEKKRIALINQDLFFCDGGDCCRSKTAEKVYMSHIRCCRPFFVVCVVYGELVSLRQNGYDIYTIEDCQDMSHFSDTQVYRR